MNLTLKILNLRTLGVYNKKKDARLAAYKNGKSQQFVICLTQRVPKEMKNYGVL